MTKHFLTGSDTKTFWQVEWFLKTYKEHNDTPILFADFGLNPEQRKWVSENFDGIIDVQNTGIKGWFYKPMAMVEASKQSDYTCWIDTDCEVLGDISGVWDEVEEDKLSICHDRPWIKRKRQEWYNTGVVAFKQSPVILHAWLQMCQSPKAELQVGDQEILHNMTIRPEQKIKYIKTLDPRYNVLRLQVQDGEDIENKLIMHWTGEKGNEIIRTKMRREDPDHNIRRVNVLGNGPSASLFKIDSGRTGKNVICNMPPFDISNEFVHATCMVDFKMMKALTENKINLDQYQWVLGNRPKKWMEKHDKFYLSKAGNIRKFYTHVPAYAENATNFNCGQLAVHYVASDLRADEIHMYGFDSIFDNVANSHTDRHLVSDKGAENSARLIGNWRPIWGGIFREFPNTTFVLHHKHENTKVKLPPNVKIVTGE